MRFTHIFACLLVLLLSLPQVQARPRVFETLDYEACRILVEQNEILSLQQLSERVMQLQLGTMIDMMLLRVESDYIYEMEIAGQSGEISYFYIDARTGVLIETFEINTGQKDEIPFFRDQPGLR